jgi:hypothetical protein
VIFCLATRTQKNSTASQVWWTAGRNDYLAAHTVAYDGLAPPHPLIAAIAYPHAVCAVAQRTLTPAEAGISLSTPQG